jgi:hypothetical protein
MKKTLMILAALTVLGSTTGCAVLDYGTSALKYANANSDNVPGYKQLRAQQDKQLIRQGCSIVPDASELGAASHNLVRSSASEECRDAFTRQRIANNEDKDINDLNTFYMTVCQLNTRFSEKGTSVAGAANCFKDKSMMLIGNSRTSQVARVTTSSTKNKKWAEMFDAEHIAGLKKTGMVLEDDWTTIPGLSNEYADKVLKSLIALEAGAK